MVQECFQRDSADSVSLYDRDVKIGARPNTDWSRSDWNMANGSKILSTAQNANSLKTNPLRSSFASLYIGSTASLADIRASCSGVYSPHTSLSPDSCGRPVVDTGWSWMVLAAYFIMSVTVGFQLGGFSVLYVRLVDYFQTDLGRVGWVGSMLPAVGNLSAVVISPLVLQFGGRTMTLLGAAIGALGIGLSSLLVSLPYMYVTYGVFGGIGMGSVMMGTLVTLQNYFDKRRPLANGIGSVGISVGQLVSGPVVQMFAESRGLFGALLLCSGIFLQNAVAGALLRPVHDTSDTSTKLDNSAEDSDSWLSYTKCKSRVCPRNLTNFPWDIFDFTLLKDYNFLIVFIGTLLSVIGCEAFFGHFMSRAVYCGISANTASILLTFVALSMVVGRAAVALIANLTNVNRVVVYGITIGLSGVAAGLFVLATQSTAFLIVGCIQGLLIGSFNSLQATVVVDLLGVDAFARAMGLLAVAIGVAFCLSIPFAGILVDISGSYDLPFLVCGSLQSFGGLAVVLYAILHRKKSNTFIDLEKKTNFLSSDI